MLDEDGRVPCGWSRTPTFYDPKYCKAIVHHCSDGSSIVSFAVSIGMSYNQMIKWYKLYPEFGEARDAAKEAQMCYWEELAKAQATGQSRGNAASLIFTMKNRFKEHYRDRQDIEVSGDLNFIVDTGIVRQKITDESPDSVEVDYTVEESSDLL